MESTLNNCPLYLTEKRGVGNQLSGKSNTKSLLSGLISYLFVITCMGIQSLAWAQPLGTIVSMALE